MSHTVNRTSPTALPQFILLSSRGKKVAAVVIASALLCLSATSLEAVDTAGTQAWDLPALTKTPTIHPAEDRPASGMRSLFYEGADYHGKPTWVFAYYSTPQGEPPVGGWPAVVCAHGGGGTAYPEWVKKWNQNGYAAIAIDLEGHLPGGNSHQVEGDFPVGQSHPNAGPARIDWFGDRDLPDREQWFYHAVADCVRAHSLLCSFPEINPQKIGLNGISWGATVASTVAGVDPRFAFVIPVYGCGFIHECDSDGLAQWFPPKNMTAQQFEDYRTKWDPSAHLPHAKMPMLWVSGFTDPVFPINIFARSAKVAGGKSLLCVRPWVIHAHGSGWDEVWEIYAFANSIVKDDPPMPSLDCPKIEAQDGLVHAACKGNLKAASLCFTTSAGKWKDRHWANIACTIGTGEVIASKTLPHNTKAFLINATDTRDGTVNSELVEVNTP